MNFETFNSDAPSLLAHLPKFGLLLVLTPLLFIVFMKFYLTLRTGSGKKTPARWIASGDLDENGLPMLARAHEASEAARFRAAMAAANPRRRR